MSYDLAKLPIQTLLRPISDAGIALARLDERIGRSPAGAGWIERWHFADACGSLWIDGELVHLEDLVLHDASHDIRAPTHELTIARDVLRTRRRIASQPPGWALSPEGLRSLRGEGRTGISEASAGGAAPAVGALSGEEEGAEMSDPLSGQFAAELAAIDAVLARSEAALDRATTSGRTSSREKDPLMLESSCCASPV